MASPRWMQNGRPPDVPSTGTPPDDVSGQATKHDGPDASSNASSDHGHVVIARGAQQGGASYTAAHKKEHELYPSITMPMRVSFAAMWGGRLRYRRALLSVMDRCGLVLPTQAT